MPRRAAPHGSSPAASALPSSSPQAVVARRSRPASPTNRPLHTARVLSTREHAARVAAVGLWLNLLEAGGTAAEAERLMGAPADGESEDARGHEEADALMCEDTAVERLVEEEEWRQLARHAMPDWLAMRACPPGLEEMYYALHAADL